MATSSRVTYKDGMAFDVELQGFHFDVDAEPAVGGANRGPRPKALLLSALGGCTGMDVVSILKKMRMPFDSFAVDVTGELSDEHPKYFKTLHVRYQFTGKELDRSKIERAVELSQKQYCGVTAMLGKSAVITTEIVLG
jgi:putative redox protein